MSQGAIISLNKNTLEKKEGGCRGRREAKKKKRKNQKESIVSERRLLHQIEMCTQNTREGECACNVCREGFTKQIRGSEGGLAVFNIHDLCREKLKDRCSNIIWMHLGADWPGRRVGWHLLLAKHRVPVLIITLFHSTLSACSVVNLLCFCVFIVFFTLLLFCSVFFTFLTPEVKCA